jgi:hypothetical protein
MVTQRILSMAALLVALGTPALLVAQSTGQAFTYASGTQQYRITTVTNHSQDQGGGRAPFQFATTTTQYVTLRLTRRTQDTLGLALRIDSLGVSSDLDAQPPDTAGFRGATVTGTMSPQGHLYTFAPPAGTPPGKVTALYRAFKQFLIPFPTTALGPGVSWTDSTVDQISRQPFTITSTMVTSWAVTGDTTVSGQKAWRIERTAIVTTSGDGKQGATPIHIDGDETIRGVRTITPTGVYLGGTATQSSQLRMSTPIGEAGSESPGTGGGAAPEQSESAPIRQTIKTTVEPLSAFRADR